MVCIQITNHFLVPKRRQSSCQHEEPFIVQGLGPHVLVEFPHYFLLPLSPWTPQVAGC